VERKKKTIGNGENGGEVEGRKGGRVKEGLRSRIGSLELLTRKPEAKRAADHQVREPRLLGVTTVGGSIYFNLRFKIFERIGDYCRRRNTIMFESERERAK
jgi:hypothetical protein